MKLFPFFLFIFFSFYAFSQEPLINTKKKDSISYYYNNAKDSLRIKYLKKSLNLSKEIQNDSLLRKISLEYGFACYLKNDSLGINEANEYLNYLYLKNKDSSLLAKRYHFKALKYKKQNKLDSIYYYYNKSKDVSLLLKDSINVGRRLLSMALMQNDEKDYLGGQTTAVEALRFLEPLKEDKYTGNTYNLLGNILTNINQFEESRYYFNKAQEKFNLRETKDSRENGKLFILNNIGYSYYVEKKYKKALAYLDKGLSSSKIDSKYKLVYKSLLGNAASCKYELGRKEEAWKDLKKLLKLQEAEDNDYILSRTHNNFANYYLLEEKKEKALYHAKKSYDLSKVGNHNFMTQMSLEKLIELTPEPQSKQYFKEYVALGEKLYKREINLKEQFALVRYETEKKEKENVGLKLKDSQSQAIIESERLQKVIFALIGILALVVSISYFRNRRKKLMYESQLEKATAREEERQQIAKSLHDEVAGDLRILHQKLANSDLEQEAKSLDVIKENVRNLSHQLSSESFDEVSFKDQVINLVTDYFSPSFRISSKGIDIVSWKEINDTIKRTFYLSIRESMQNTLKYAEANKFFISFSMEKKEIVLFLEDNGKGFDISSGKKGIGLKNLKERVEEIHGSFQIESTEKGTKTRISIPVNGK